MPAEQQSQRRPLTSRDKSWAVAAARLLLQTPITPDQISLLGIAFSCVGAWALLWETRWGLLVAALSIQLRLLCNMLDGMVALEGGRAAPDGPLFNEVPDRIEDTLLIVAFGYAAGLGWFGFAAALLAMFTAYIRLLGASFGFPQDFRGPMAKQHRMAALTLGCAAAFIESLVGPTHGCLEITLIVVAAGALVTAARRILAISAQLRARKP
jgi:phosphatidylglycerophosphate synthase